MGIEIEFHGAAGEVTGSCHVLRYGSRTVLLDCGLIQGGREEFERNAAPFPVDAADVDLVVLSHAHIDHCGRLPLLLHRGFRGRIVCTAATAALLKIMLEDAARLMLADVEARNRRRQRSGLPLHAPLYDLEDVQDVIACTLGCDYGETVEALPGLQLRFLDAGHIIGSAIVEACIEDGARRRRLVYSGDIGPKDAPIMCDPTPLQDADLVLLESTYGDRLHRPRTDTEAEIGAVLAAARRQGGTVLVPAFAVGRSQEFLYVLSKHVADWKLDRFRIFLDSPMASRVVRVYQKFRALFDPEAIEPFAHKQPFKLPHLRFVDTAEESRALNSIDGGAIIIAGSGMCNGGRIQHHLKHRLWQSKTQVLIVGYQAQGTLGRQLVDGRREVRILHEQIQVNAQIHTVGGLSAHADQAGLLDWYDHFRHRPPVVLVHGEDRAREALAAQLETRGTTVTLARPGARMTL
ncbi:MAG: MBL fold metallo-hydrolase [Xanthomonadales bacterium]|jgi:metallo-beta-lactamase family protein|nr:MBL fold metallo-hydrolase [Xanthomonadales bacterium]